MNVHFFHLMPYADIDMAQIDKHQSAWVTLPNSNFDPAKGRLLYERYLRELELADEPCQRREAEEREQGDGQGGGPPRMRAPEPG